MMGGKVMENIKKIIILLLICFLSIRLGVMIFDAYSYRKEKKIETEKVVEFFRDNGYEIRIMGAYEKGRESEGPFLYGCYWSVFDIGIEEILLFYFEDEKYVQGYLENLDDTRRKQCYLSSHFVFWYYGNNDDITETIIKFCTQY